MAEICILTDDERLFRMLTLLCLESGHTVGTDAPVVLITDERAVPARVSALPRLLIGEGELTRPFSHRIFQRKLTEILSEEALPPLTPTERRLYEALRAASPAPVSREALSRLVFGGEGEGAKLTLYIHYLRKKIEKDGVKRIFASHGKGYFYDASHTFR